MTGPEADGGGEQPRYVAPPPFGNPGQPQYPPPYGYPPQQPYPGYGVPAGYVAVPAYYPLPPAPPVRLAFGLVDACLAAAGFLLLVVSLLGLDWYTGGDGGVTTSDVRDLLDGYGDLANSLSVAYFSWLAWVLLLLAAGSAAISAMPVPGLSLAFRIAGPIVAGFAVLMTFGAIELTQPLYSDDTTFDQYFDRLTWGFWLAIIGFVLIGAGAIVGPRKLRG